MIILFILLLLTGILYIWWLARALRGLKRELAEMEEIKDFMEDEYDSLHKEYEELRKKYEKDLTTWIISMN